MGRARNLRSATESAVDIALKTHRAHVKETEDMLRADPEFRAACEASRRWDKASAAVEAAIRPFEDALDELRRQHPNGYPGGSPVAEKVTALIHTVNHTRTKVFAEHGFRPRPDPRTVEELWREIKPFDIDYLTDRIESAAGSQPGPDEVWPGEVARWWGLAASMCREDDTIMPLPVPAPTVRDRFYQLREWCRCVTTAGTGKNLRPLEQAVVAALRKRGRRMTGAEIAAAAWEPGKQRKQLLAAMVHKGVLTNAEDGRGRGYGLAEWTPR